MNHEASPLTTGRNTNSRQGSSKQIEIIGVPLDLKQQRRGADMGSSALRVAGLEAKLEALGHTVTDRGDAVRRKRLAAQSKRRNAKLLRPSTPGRAI